MNNGAVKLIDLNFGSEILSLFFLNKQSTRRVCSYAYEQRDIRCQYLIPSSQDIILRMDGVYLGENKLQDLKWSADAIKPIFLKGLPFKCVYSYALGLKNVQRQFLIPQDRNVTMNGTGVYLESKEIFVKEAAE